MKIRPLKAELFHADKYDDTHSRFSQFCEKRLKSKKLRYMWYVHMSVLHQQADTH